MSSVLVDNGLDSEVSAQESIVPTAPIITTEPIISAESVLSTSELDLEKESTASLDLEPIDRSIILSDSSNSDSLAPLDTAVATLASEEFAIASQVSPNNLFAISPILGVGQPFVYQNVTFTPFLFLVNRSTGTVQANVLATVAPNTGSVTIEISDPFLYFDPIRQPQPQPEGFPVAVGTPQDLLGVTGSFTFNFENQARFTGGAGFYGFGYEVRVTNNEGSFPSPTTFQEAPFVIAQVLLGPAV